MNAINESLCLMYVCTIAYYFQHIIGKESYMYTVWVKKFPLQFSDKWLGIFNNFLHTYYAFLSTLDYKFLFSYLHFDEIMPY